MTFSSIFQGISACSASCEECFSLFHSTLPGVHYVDLGESFQTHIYIYLLKYFSNNINAHRGPARAPSPSPEPEPQPRARAPAPSPGWSFIFGTITGSLLSHGHGIWRKSMESNRRDRFLALTVAALVDHSRRMDTFWRI